MNINPGIAALLGLAALLLSMNLEPNAPTQQAMANSDPEAVKALPTLEDIPGFTKRTVENEGLGAKSVWLTRKRDLARIRVMVYVAPTESQAQKTSRSLTGSVINGRWLEGSLTGRSIGQEAWKPQHMKNLPTHYSTGLVARDGRSIIKIALDLDVQRDKEGKPLRDKQGNWVHRSMTQADLRLIERQAALCLSKLTKMGYTSKSVQPKG